jgi:hypothetical protein
LRRRRAGDFVANGDDAGAIDARERCETGNCGSNSGCEKRTAIHGYLDGQQIRDIKPEV